MCAGAWSGRPTFQLKRMLRRRAVRRTKSSGRMDARWVLRVAWLKRFQARMILRSRYLRGDRLTVNVRSMSCMKQSREHTGTSVPELLGRR